MNDESRRSESSATRGRVGCSVTIGNLLAAGMSYMMGNSIGWIIVHFFCSWLYVFWVCLGCGGDTPFDIWTTPAREVVEEGR